VKKAIKRRKLRLQSETLKVVRVLLPGDLRDAKVAGASDPNCPPTGCPNTNSQTQ
jgi:hypothetical protein